MEIKIKQRELYGIIKFYPACDISQGLVELLGQKVFTIQNIKKLESIGFKKTSEAIKSHFKIKEGLI